MQQSSYDQLLDKQVRLKNLEKLHEYVGALIRIMENEDSGVSEALRQAFSPMKALEAVDPNTSGFMEKLSRVQEISDELLGDLRHYLDNLSFEPEEAREIHEACDAYEDILRKYGPTLEAAAGFYQSAKQKYDFLTNLEQNDLEVNQQIALLAKKLEGVAQKISKERKRAAQEMQKTIEKELKELGIAHVRFECRFSKAALNAEGYDQVDFYISPNAGEELKPLAEIVSFLFSRFTCAPRILPCVIELINGFSSGEMAGAAAALPAPSTG